MKPSIWTGFFAEDPLDIALRKLHDCGWKHFELSDEHLCGLEKSSRVDREIEDALAVMGDCGLDMLQAHGLLSANFAHPTARERDRHIARLTCHIDLCARLGVKVITIHPGSISHISDKGWQVMLGQNVDAFRRLADVAAESEMKIGIENLFWSKVTTAEEMLDILDAIDHPAVGITLDTSHANMVGIDIPTMIETFGERIIATHISDNYGSGDDHKIPGWGTINWPEVVTALRTINYQGLFNLEIPGERHPVEGIRKLKCRLAYEAAILLLG